MGVEKSALAPCITTYNNALILDEAPSENATGVIMAAAETLLRTAVRIVVAWINK